MAVLPKLYEAQLRHWETYKNDEKLSRIAQSWLDDSTVDAWRHRRMLSCIDGILQTHPGSKWLTVGDGRYAYETRYLLRMDPTAQVTSTDISGIFLEESLQRGLIQQYQTENCEALSFADKSFDYVLCKETFHHLVRPYIALYEMLRVCRSAVILIEPNEGRLAAEQLRKYGQMENGYIPLKYMVRSVLRKMGVIPLLRRLRGYAAEPAPPDLSQEFEPVGNFVYSISEREMEKVALGIGLPAIAFRSMNDYYEEGVEFEKADESSALFKKVKSNILKSDSSGKNNILCTIFFCEEASPELIRNVAAKKVEYRKLPRSPVAGPP